MNTFRTVAIEPIDRFVELAAGLFTIARQFGRKTSEIDERTGWPKWINEDFLPGETNMNEIRRWLSGGFHSYTFTLFVYEAGTHYRERAGVTEEVLQAACEQLMAHPAFDWEVRKITGWERYTHQLEYGRDGKHVRIRLKQENPVQAWWEQWDALTG